LLVLNGGYNPPSISVLDVAAEKEISRAPVPDGWLGLTFSPKGDLSTWRGLEAAVYESSTRAHAYAFPRLPVVAEAQRTVRIS